jgi:hypothetical protein
LRTFLGFNTSSGEMLWQCCKQSQKCCMCRGMLQGLMSQIRSFSLIGLWREGIFFAQFPQQFLSWAINLLVQL